jgi:hypothetical protein
MNRRRTLNIQHGTNCNMEHPTSNVEAGKKTSNIEHPTSNAGVNIEHRTSNVEAGEKTTALR